MDCHYVGSKVDVIRPDTGEALAGTCVSKTKEGWVIQGEDEEVFGPSPVVVWLRTVEQESVVQGRMRPLNGAFMSLKQTGVLLRVSHGREDRYAVDGITASCMNLGETVQLKLTNVGCRGFGFQSTAIPTSLHETEFTVTGPSGEFTMVGQVAHISPSADGMFRGGVCLKLESAIEKRKWLAILALTAQTAA